jgi:uncharacterized membrane protein
MQNVAFFFHILGVVTLSSGIVVAGVAFEAARRRDSPSEIALLLGLTRAGVALVGAGSILVGAFGLWLVHLGNFGYGSGWVDTSIGLFVVALVLGSFGGQRPQQARLHAAELARTGSSADAKLHALLNDRVSLLENYASLLLLLAIIAVMCFKP